MAVVSMKERLSLYSLADKAGTLADLRLGPGEHKVVTKDSPEFNAHVVALRPTSVRDLRAWIGGRAASATGSKGTIPKGERAKAAAGEVAHPVSFSNVSSVASEMPAPFDAAFHADMYALTRKYVLDRTGTINPAIEGSIEQWLVTLNPTIWSALFNDIYVSAGSSLTFAADVSILFAHYVTVEDTGQILIQSGTFNFDLAGFTGGVPPRNGGTGTSGTSGTTGTTGGG
jgi:hypothetical protein